MRLVTGSMGITRAGRLSSSRSKSSKINAEALREKTLKLTPPAHDSCSERRASSYL